MNRFLSDSSITTITGNTDPKIHKIKHFDGKQVSPGEFEAENHFYPRVLNAQLHPLVSSFFNLGNKRIVARYTHLNPSVQPEVLLELLNYQPKYFHWAGSDLFNVTTVEGKKQMLVVETNSCPSGQKSMPLLDEQGNEYGGYRIVVENCVKEVIGNTDPSLGDLAVVFDKNAMEATGYASVLADLTGEKVWLAEFHWNDNNPPVKWIDGLMYIRDAEQVWHPIRGCFKYVTQKPWNRFPLKSKTAVINHIVSCLAGGRNKAMAARAYDFLNAELVGTGLSVRIPETIRNVLKSEVPLLIDAMGGTGVIKVPYANAGQGVYTITNSKELDAFMNSSHHYDKFIVQSLVGNASWSSTTKTGKFFHVGTIPDKKNNYYVVDIRMMVCGTQNGFKPVALYARRARKPLAKDLGANPEVTSWDMLGTNLSVKMGESEWTTDAQRLVLMDRKDFNNLGIGIDDLIDSYIQTVLSVIAIDKLSARLMKSDSDGYFNLDLFGALNPDAALLEEILIA